MTQPPSVRYVAALPAWMRRLDLPLLTAALSLSLLGVALIWSASGSSALLSDAARQLLSLAVAIALGLLLLRAEPRALRAWAIPVYLGCLTLMLGTFSPMGVSVSGARAWLALPGGFTVQPSEFAKLGLILILATTLSGSLVTGQAAGVRKAAGAVGWAAPYILLVLAQRDTGTAMIMTAITISCVVISGVGLRVVLAGLLTAVALVALAVAAGGLADYQVQRFLAFVDPYADPYGYGHNTIQAQLAIGSGGWFGDGLGAGNQTQGGFVPVNESDFIFTVVAEELGLVGGLAVIALLAVIVWRGLRIALAARDLFGRLVATGVVAWFSFQAFENLGMALGIMPVTGVTLPFVSYGGSSLIAAWLGIALLQLVHRSGSDWTRRPVRDRPLSRSGGELT
ncbi:MAG: rod shape-determining protein RodA [Actinobacteria bacterium]|nr:rod shape-determining protein RodA [Actinomycetota bacterium]